MNNISSYTNLFDRNIGIKTLIRHSWFWNIDQCDTKVRGPRDPSGHKCEFPFTFGGMTYEKCTNIGGLDAFWCATEVDNSGKMLHGRYGVCEDNCAKYGN